MGGKTVRFEEAVGCDEGAEVVEAMMMVMSPQR